MKAPTIFLKPELEKKAYRLKCRFTVEANSLPDWVEKIKYKVAEEFVSDMEKQGWKYDPNKLPPAERGFKLSGPFSHMQTVQLPKFSTFKAAEALPRVRAGDRMRDNTNNYVQTVPLLDQTDKWEYELSAVFIRSQILTELPDSWEEAKELKSS